MDSLSRLCLIAFILSFDMVFCQTTEYTKEHGHNSPHSVGMLVGYSWVPETINEQGESYFKVNPTLGLDYTFFFNENIGVGVVNDIEFASYEVLERDGGFLKRENKYIGAIVFTYKPLPYFGVYFGPGFEFDFHDSFQIVKAGIEATKHFEEGWGVGLNASIDYSEFYETISAGLMVFKRFPR